jgi:KTSC domain
MRVITSVNSQVIEQIAYDTYKHELVVTINGNDYFYYKVSFEKFRRFYEADSKGSFFNMYVKGRW